MKMMKLLLCVTLLVVAVAVTAQGPRIQVEIGHITDAQVLLNAPQAFVVALHRGEVAEGSKSAIRRELQHMGDEYAPLVMVAEIDVEKHPEAAHGIVRIS